MIPFAATLAALGILLAHGVAASARRAERFPSLQFVPRAARSWRLPAPLDERVRLLLRLLFVALLAAAFLAARREERARRVGAVVLDPLGPPAEARRAADALRARLESEGISVVTLVFEGDTPRVECAGGLANARGRALARLEGSSEPRLASLRRAAHLVADATWVVSDFTGAAWRSSPWLPFTAVRVPAAAAAPGSSPPLPAIAAGRRVFVATGAGDDSRRALFDLWAAALAANEGTRAERIAETELAGLDVKDALLVADGARAESRAFAERGGAVVSPGGAAVGVDGITFDESARPAAGREAEGEKFGSSFPTSPGFRALAGSLDRTRLVLAWSSAGRGRVVRASGTADDLGGFAHDGALARLARVAASFAVARPTIVSEPPPADRFFWRRGGKLFPVGLVDVPPGRYVREDGAVEYAAARKADEAREPAPLDDATLASLGARRGPEVPKGGEAGVLIPALFVAALLLRLLDRPPRGRFAFAVHALHALGIAALVLLVLDVRPSFWRNDRRLVKVVLPAAGDARLRDELSRALGPLFDVRSERGEAIDDERPAIVRNAEPRVQAVVGSLDSPPDVSDAAVSGRDDVGVPILLVGGESRPGVRLVAVDAPAAVGVGEPASLFATLLTRNVRGETARLELGDAGGLLASVRIPPGSSVLRLSLPLTAARPGRLFAVVRSRGVGAAAAAVVKVEGRPAARRVLIVAGSPSWEARRALEALAAPHVDTSVTAAFGRAAGIARRSESGSVAMALSSPSLAGLDAAVLESVGKEECPAACARGVAEAVQRGLGLLVLGDPLHQLDDSGLLPARARGATTTSPAALAGELDFGAGSEPVSFEGFPPAPAELAPGAVVLGRLGRREEPRRPWIVGREIGRGRVVQILAPDLWRASEHDRRRVLLEALAFALAREKAAKPRPEEAAALLAERRARLAEAARHSRVGMAEVTRVEEAAAILSKLPEPPERRVELRTRRSRALAILLLALVTFETFVRRRAAAPISRRTDRG